jgi:putative endonuclease
MMGSASRRALYTGVTALLYERVWEHKNKLGGYFTSKYKCYRLVYFEQFTNIETAIEREKEIKGWRREKKNKFGGIEKPRLEGFGCGLVCEGIAKGRRSGKASKIVKRKVPRPYSRACTSARSLRSSG